MRFVSFTRQADLIKNRIGKIKEFVDQTLISAKTQPLQVNKIEKLKCYSKELEDRRTALENLIEKLYAEASLADEEINDITVGLFNEEVSELYVETQSLIKMLLPPENVTQLQPRTDTTPLPSTSNMSVRLPKIDMAHFSGDPNSWISFSNLFESTIHRNNNLAEVEKFQYLLSILRGEALNVVKSLPLTAPNYQIAWEMLYKRYHNVRRLVSYHISKILDMPNTANGSIKNLRDFLSTYSENTQALVALQYDITKESTLLVAILLRKLDSELRNRFEHSRDSNCVMPSVDDLICFLEKECIELENASIGRTTFTKPSSQRASKTALITIKDKRIKDNSCVYCNDVTHNIYKCGAFSKLSPQERHSLVRSKHWCFNCFGVSHTLKTCKSTRTCSICGKRHHSMIHLNSATTDMDAVNAMSNNKSMPSDHKSANNTTENAFVGFSSYRQPASVLLATTLVNITTPQGISHVFRGVLDSAAQISCITERAVQLLKAKRIKTLKSLSGLSLASVKTRGLIHANISALNGKFLAQSHPMIILENITSNMPRSNVSPVVKKRMNSLILADPTFDMPGPVDVLIGADLFALALTGQRHYLGENIPVALGTIFGFVVMGSTPVTSSCESHNESTALLTTNELDLHASLQQFWQIEEPPYPPLSPEERYTEEYFVANFCRDPSGRYIVRLPFKESHPPLGDSSAMAKRRFLSLEKRFKLQPEFHDHYVNFMKDYLESGHMTPYSSQMLDQPHYYLPHHGIFKLLGSMKKIRVVFDASARTSNNISLNDILLSGPKLQNNICDVILNFRRHAVVFSCDITQMFRNIMLHPNDQSYQLIYWRSQPSAPLLQYKLTTVTYGMTSSPFLAIRTLRQLAQDEEKTFPRAANVLCTQIFVDDIVTGSDTLEEAFALKDELTRLLRLGGFELHKWSSNSPSLLESIPPQHRQLPIHFQSRDTQLRGVLGLQWDPLTDTFSYGIKIMESQLTKRSVLSVIAKMYDPCGWITPVVFWAKSFMQLLWTLGLTWDDPLPSDVASKWEQFLKEIPLLENINVQRHLLFTQSISIELHGFSDASQLGYSAVVYVRSVNQNQEVKISLLIAKSRVSPLKRISLPRLELCGAHLLAKLLNYCILQLSPHLKIENISAWCDSTIVLSWIQTPSYRLKTYVANRVSEIQEWIPSHSWAHISSDLNPADCASRGLMPSQINAHFLWWNGPKWLASATQDKPAFHFVPIKDDHLPEIKLSPINALISADRIEWDLLTQFSSWMKLIRILAYVLRFIHNSRSKNKFKNFLTATELKKSINFICKIVQHSCFSEDLTSLQKDRTCSLRIRRLSPFFDKDGVLRAGGRLENSHLGFEAKHPIILPKNHHVVNLLIDHYHLKYLHAGPQLLQSILSQEYWILAARSVIRARVFKCLRCYRFKPINMPPLMGDLPESRVSPTRPFLKIGMDYGGPFQVKLHTLKRSQLIKAYLCLFVCFSTKAVHLEVVTDLSSDAFISALTRFISRRGLCSDLYSDCGTNFKGASTKLAAVMKRVFNSTDFQNKISYFSSQHSINFHFLPPASPHQGGLWESAIKNAKCHLLRVIGKHILTLEEFITLTTKTEAMLNSRPLTPLSSDPSEVSALTPGHFLIGAPLVALPEDDWSNIPMNRLSRWKLVEALSQRLWKRWHLEYLHTLQQRTKWTLRKGNLKIGDLVLVHEHQTPPLSWCLGRITATFPGKDGVVRVVQLQTKGGNLSRPAIKVFPLPLN